jgi:hypothetical protein
VTQTRQRYAARGGPLRGYGGPLYAARGGPLRGYGGPLRGYGGRAATRHLVAAAPKPRRGLDEVPLRGTSIPYPSKAIL